MTKLLFLVTEDWYFCSHRLPLAQKAVRSGMEVIVATRISDRKKVIEASGIRIIPVELDRSSINPFKEIISILKLYKILRKEQPDIVHLVAMKPVILGGIAAMLAGIRHRISAVAGLGFLFAEDERNSLLSLLVLKILVFLSRKGKIIVQNREDANLLCQAGINETHISLIRGAGVDVQMFAYIPEPSGVPVVMLASRLLWDKGVGEFVHAAKILHSKGLKARFVLVGSPDYANPNSVTEKDIEVWVSEGIIEWWGNSNNMPQTLVKANIVCLPSYYKEGLPKILLEAMSVGRACITTDIPGCREAIIHGENGLLVPIKNPEALAKAIERLLRDDKKRSEMGHAGRKMAEKLFSQEKIIAETMKIYEKLLSKS